MVMADESMIFKVSDLVQSRTELLRAAREGRARVRDTDGTGLVMLREDELRLLELVADWSRAHSRLQRLLQFGKPPTVTELGERLAWLRVFDLADLQEFANELDDALVATRADGDSTPLRHCLDAWRGTARQLEDPLRRSVLHGLHVPDDFEEVERPESAADVQLATSTRPRDE